MQLNRLNIEKFAYAKVKVITNCRSHVALRMHSCVCVCVTQFVWIMHNLLVNVRASNPFFALAFNVTVYVASENKQPKQKVEQFWELSSHTEKNKRKKEHIQSQHTTITTIRMVCLFELHLSIFLCFWVFFAFICFLFLFLHQ